MPNSDVSDILTRAKALIDTEDKWCQRQWKSGEKRCLLSAISAVAWDDDLWNVSDYTNARIALRPYTGHDIAAFNDTHTHAEVMAALDRAITVAHVAASLPGEADREL